MDDAGIVDGDVCADGVRRPSIRLRGGGCRRRGSI